MLHVQVSGEINRLEILLVISTESQMSVQTELTSSVTIEQRLRNTMAWLPCYLN
jgi:hypothetical protein